MILLVHTKSYTRMPVTREENDSSLRNAGGFVTPELKLFSSFLGGKKKKISFI